MSKNYPLPEGYASINEARGRAAKRWPTEPDARLLDHLISGKLSTSQVNERGTVRPLPPEYWIGQRLSSSAAGETVGIKSTGQSWGRPVVAVGDLDSIMPPQESAARAAISLPDVQEPNARFTPFSSSPPGFMPIRQATELCAATWGVKIDDAWDRLRPHLIDGSVRTLEVDINGNHHSQPELWSAQHNIHAYVEGRLAVLTPDAASPKEWRDGYIYARALAQLLGALPSDEPIPPLLNQAVSTRRMGRPVKIGHDAFWVEACRLIFSGDCVPGRDKLEDFVAALMKWMRSKKSGLYAEDTVRDKVKAIWKALDPSRP